MIQKHCFECGTALIEKELEEEGIVPYCPKCQQYRFPMYNVAVSMIVVDEETGKILLIQQYGKPSYILVAGYVNRGEAEEHAVVREVREETGLGDIELGRLICITNHCYIRNGIWHLKHTWWYHMHYTAPVDLTPQKEEDISKAAWVSRSSIPAYLKDSYPSIAEVFRNMKTEQ